MSKNEKAPLGTRPATCSVWIATEVQLPPEFDEVLGWDRKRGFSIWHWMHRKPDVHEMCVEVNKTSGYMVDPPKWWKTMPAAPNA